MKTTFQKQMKAQGEGINVVIARRLRTVRHASQILVTAKDRIVERGTHEDFVAPV